jgi:hypothetical protein
VCIELLECKASFQNQGKKSKLSTIKNKWGKRSEQLWWHTNKKNYSFLHQTQNTNFLENVKLSTHSNLKGL